MGFLDKVMDDVLGDPFGSYHQAATAEGAARVQAGYAEEGVEEQRRQHEVARLALEPYARAGRFGLYGAPGEGMSEREMYGTENPFAKEVSQMTHNQLTEALGAFKTQGGDPMYEAALRAQIDGQDPTWAGSEYSGEMMDPGGVFGYARAGDEALPILQQYAQAGGDALEAQRALTGLSGADAQASAIEGLRGTPEYDMLVRESEESLLQNASATGGVRGGNTTSALMEKRPGILVDMINRKYNQYGGLAGAGGNVAGALASGGQNVYQNLANAGQAGAGALANNATNLGANVNAGLQNVGAYTAGGMQAGAAGAGSGLRDAMSLANTVSSVGSGFGGFGGLTNMFSGLSGGLSNLFGGGDGSYSGNFFSRIGGAEGNETAQTSDWADALGIKL